jgi:hypothetical protein
MNKLYLLYAVILILVFGLAALLFHVSLSALLSFFWGGCAMLILFNFGSVVKMLELIFEGKFSEVLSKPSPPSTIQAPAPTNFRDSDPTEAPASTNVKEVDEVIRQSLGEIDKQERGKAAASKNWNSAARPNSKSSSKRIQSKNINHPPSPRKSGTSNQPDKKKE